MANPPISDDRKKKLAADCFKRGNEAMMKQNWEYSCEMFRQCVNLVPENLLFRQSLRGVTEKKYNGNKTGASMSGMRLVTTKASIKKSRMSKDWNSVINLCEDGLALNPWEAGLNAELGEALAAVGFTDAAVFSYERACVGEPNNKEWHKTLAKLYAERKNFDKAIDAMTKVTRIDPMDGEARSLVTAYMAEKVQIEGKYDESGKMIQKAMSDKNADNADGPGMSQQADLERACRKDPSKDNYLRLADFLKRDGQLEKAAEALERALEASDGEVKIREQLDDIRIDLLRKEFGLAQEEYQKDKEDNFAKRKYQDLRAKLRALEIEVYASRIDRYPQNLALKYDLGMLYIDDGRHQLAIPLLQKARSDNRRKLDALAALGKCFIKEKQLPLARRQFEQAIPDCNPDDNQALFLDLNYLAGRVCEELKDKEAAIKYYQAVLEYDYDYKDNRERLNRLETGEE